VRRTSSCLLRANDGHFPCSGTTSGGPVRRASYRLMFIRKSRSRYERRLFDSGPKDDEGFSAENWSWRRLLRGRRGVLNRGPLRLALYFSV
jgi:hypothetical protein